MTYGIDRNSVNTLLIEAEKDISRIEDGHIRDSIRQALVISKFQNNKANYLVEENDALRVMVNELQGELSDARREVERYYEDLERRITRNEMAITMTKRGGVAISGALLSLLFEFFRRYLGWA